MNENRSLRFRGGARDQGRIKTRKEVKRNGRGLDQLEARKDKQEKF